MVAGPAGQPQPVPGGLAALALVAGDALSHGTAVPGSDLGTLPFVQAGPAGGTGGSGLLVRPDQQADHGSGPDLAVGAGFVQAFQVAQPAGAAPGMHGVSEVLIAGVAVPHRQRRGLGSGRQTALRPAAGIPGTSHRDQHIHGVIKPPRRIGWRTSGPVPAQPRLRPGPGIATLLGGSDSPGGIPGICSFLVSMVRFSVRLLGV